MSDADEVRQYLRHIVFYEGQAAAGCICPADSWAPCGGQYEGRYADGCPPHTSGPDRASIATHYPPGCPKGTR